MRAILGDHLAAAAAGGAASPAPRRSGPVTVQAAPTARRAGSPAGSFTKIRNVSSDTTNTAAKSSPVSTSAIPAGNARLPAAAPGSAGSDPVGGTPDGDRRPRRESGDR